MYNIRMDLLLKKALEFAETKRTNNNSNKNKVEPMHLHNRLKQLKHLYQNIPLYQYPIHRNNQRVARVAFEVQHQPAMLHPRPETANRRAYTQYPRHSLHSLHPLHKIQTVDELCIREGYVRPGIRSKTTVNIAPVAPVLLRRANTAKINSSQVPRASQVPRVLKTKPTSRQLSHKQSPKKSGM